MITDLYMDAHINNPSWVKDSPAATSELNVGLLIEYLKTLPMDTVVYCPQDEKFSTGDSAIDYFPANLRDCFVIKNDELYIGNIEL